MNYAPDVAAKNKDFTVIEPGQSLNFTHNFGGVYNFTDSGVTSYTVSPASPSLDFTHVGSNDTLSSIRAVVENDVHAVKLTGNLTPKSYLDETAARSFSKRGNTFASCTPDRVYLVNSAVLTAELMVYYTYYYLATLGYASPRWVTWFGQSFTATNKANILSHYKVSYHID